MMDVSQHTDESQIQIRFVTKQEIYAVPDVPFSVPFNIDAISLNKLLHELLKESLVPAKPIEFDFIVLGELLRAPLQEHLQERNASTETTVEVEYIQRTPAPQPQDALLHEDWVGGVQLADKWVLTGCYDYAINIWSIKGKHQLSATEHSNLIRAVSWLKQSDPSSGFVSVAHDQTAVLWHWIPGSDEVTPLYVLKGHERGIDSVGVSPDGQHLATGSWDTYLKLWSASLEAEEEPARKRSRGKRQLAVRTPLSTLKGHREAVIAVNWINGHTIVTTSMDHTIRLWDADMCGLQNEILGQKAFLDADWSPLNRSLITASADRHIRLYDPRSTEGHLCKQTFTSHTLWVSSICWSQHDEHLFMSGGYDDCVKVWDVRSNNAPLYDLSGHTGKVLCVDWSNATHMVSGGTDNSIHIFKNMQFQ